LAAEAQAFPQPPQFWGSPARLVHAPAHTVRPAAQDTVHTPPAHTLPDTQALSFVPAV
jgi:hypothetical protein